MLLSLDLISHNLFKEIGQGQVHGGKERKGQRFASDTPVFLIGERKEQISIVEEPRKILFKTKTTERLYKQLKEGEINK